MCYSKADSSPGLRAEAGFGGGEKMPTSPGPKDTYANTDEIIFFAPSFSGVRQPNSRFEE